MWEITVLTPDLMPSWAKNIKETSDERAERWARQGKVRLDRHFRYDSSPKKCECCGHRTKNTKKVYS